MRPHHLWNWFRGVLRAAADAENHKSRKQHANGKSDFCIHISPANKYTSTLLFLELKHVSPICVKFGVVSASPGNHLKTLTLPATFPGILIPSCDSHSHLWRIKLRHSFHSVNCLPCFSFNYHVHQGGPLQTRLRIGNHIKRRHSRHKMSTLHTPQKIRLMEEILHQLIGSLSHSLQGFIYAGWLFGISSTNSITALRLKWRRPSSFHTIWVLVCVCVGLDESTNDPLKSTWNQFMITSRNSTDYRNRTRVLKMFQYFIWFRSLTFIPPSHGRPRFTPTVINPYFIEASISGPSGRPENWHPHNGPEVRNIFPWFLSTLSIQKTSVSLESAAFPSPFLFRI